MKRFFTIALAAVSLLFSAANLSADDYTPLQISLVPGLAIPFGASHASIVLGTVGNISGKVDLLQAAGVFNITREITGLQAAGVFNIASEGMEGIQAGGVFNIAEDTRTPIQIGGVFNIAKGLQGLQVAGVFNISGDVEGAQAAGVFNVADDVDGFQVGLVNIADHVNGIQLGLVNISSNGVFEITGSWEGQTDYVFGTLKTGNTSVFGVYSVASPSADRFKVPESMILSAGLGTRIGNSKAFFMDLSVSASQAVGPDAVKFVNAIQYKNGLVPGDVLAPWPTLDASLTLDMGALRLVGGVRTDINMGSAPYLPASLAKGLEYSDTWLGESFSAWTKWYIGVGL